MRLGNIIRTCAFGSALAIAAAASVPAMAGDGHHHGGEPGVAPPGPDNRPSWGNDAGPPPPPQAMQDRVREDWLSECRARLSRRDDGVGGAVIGGLVGGVAGNRIAGRGNRTAGTLVGAGVGAVAGAAIDRAEDRGRSRDDCEAYLDNYYASYGRGGYGAGYGYAPAYSYGYGVPMMMVPVMMVPKGQPECTETVETIYEDVPVRRRVYRAPRRVVHDKRVRVIDKRLPAD